MKKTQADYSFQNSIITRTVKKLKVTGKALIAAAPASGKTFMSIKVMMRLFKSKHIDCALILTHGQGVLRTQYGESLKELKIKDYIVLKPRTHIESSSKIVVALPHSYRKLQHIKFDLIIIDEAHHFFRAQMVQDIIKNNPDALLLCLTGSPGEFTREGDWDGEYISTQELLQSNVIINAKFLFSPQPLNIKWSCFNNQNELKESIKFTQKSVECALLNSLDLTVIGKKMIVCKDIYHTKQIAMVLKKHKKKFCISHSENDIKSIQIQKFIDEDSIKILVVVRRAVLGFDMKKLNSIIDFSGSLNPEFMFQLFNRITRRGFSGKRYIKICPSDMLDANYVACNVSADLTREETYRTYKGQYKNHSVSIPSEDMENVRKYSLGDNNYVPEIDLELFLKTANSNSYAKTSLKIIKELSENSGKLNKEAVLETARQCESLKDFRENYSAQYKHAQKNNYLVDIREILQGMTWDLKRKILLAHEKCEYSGEIITTKWDVDSVTKEFKKHISRNELIKHSPYAYKFAHRFLIYDKLKKYLGHKNPCTHDSVKKKAQEFSTRKDFKDSCKDEWNYAARHSILGEVCSHMKRRIMKSWDYETIHKKAQKHASRTEFSRAEPNAYSYALKYKFLDKVCAHMPKYKGKWTHALAKKEALKYNNKGELSKASPGAYSYIQREHIGDMCYSHMKMTIKWDCKLAAQEAKKYKTRVEFRKKSGSGYSFASRNNILDVVCSHMKSLKRLNWTHKTVTKEARKYKSKADFRKLSSGAYGYAVKQRILNTICIHMR